MTINPIMGSPFNHSPIIPPPQNLERSSSMASLKSVGSTCSRNSKQNHRQRKSSTSSNSSSQQLHCSEQSRNAGRLKQGNSCRDLRDLRNQPEDMEYKEQFGNAGKNPDNRNRNKQRGRRQTVKGSSDTSKYGHGDLEYGGARPKTLSVACDGNRKLQPEEETVREHRVPHRGRGRGRGRYFRGQHGQNRKAQQLLNAESILQDMKTHSFDSEGIDSDLESWVSEAGSVANVRELDRGHGRYRCGRGRKRFPRGCGYTGSMNEQSRGRNIEHASRHINTENASGNTTGQMRGEGRRGRVNRRGVKGKPWLLRGKKKVQNDSSSHESCSDVNSLIDGDVDEKDSTDEITNIATQRCTTSQSEDSNFNRDKSRISLHDLETVSLQILKNRSKRYKEKLRELQRRGISAEEVTERKIQIEAVEEEIKKRNEMKENMSHYSDEETSESEDEDVTQKPKMHATRATRNFSMSKKMVFKPRLAKQTKTKQLDLEEQESSSSESNRKNVSNEQEKINGKKRKPRRRNRPRKNQSANPTDVDEVSVIDDIKVTQPTNSVPEPNKNLEKKRASRNPAKPGVLEMKDLDEVLSKFDVLIKGGQKTLSSVYEPRREETPATEDTHLAVSDSKPVKEFLKEELIDSPTIQKDMPTEDLPKPKSDLSKEVFRYIVKEFKGKGSPDEIKRESGLFPVDCDVAKWFKVSRLFNTIEKNGKVVLVLVCLRDISYCIDYIKTVGCTKDCERFHVCKDMLCENCNFGSEECKFSHNFLDERNAKTANKLGLKDVFTNEEICNILMVRYPHVCRCWVENGDCEDEESCTDLHLCPDFILGKCENGEECPFGHDKASNHNRPIVKAFGMQQWKDTLFCRLIYLPRFPKQDLGFSSGRTDVEHGATGGIGRKKSVSITNTGKSLNAY